MYMYYIHVYEVLPNSLTLLTALTQVQLTPCQPISPFTSPSISLPSPTSLSSLHPSLLPSSSLFLSLLTQPLLPSPTHPLTHHCSSLLADGIKLIKYDNVKSTVDTHTLLLRLCLCKQLPERGRYRSERERGKVHRQMERGGRG